jgi:hypothetical protein
MPENEELNIPNEAPLANDTQEAMMQRKETAFDLNVEMKKQLVDTLFEVFEAGGRSENSFKKAIFEQPKTFEKHTKNESFLLLANARSRRI